MRSLSHAGGILLLASCLSSCALFGDDADTLDPTKLTWHAIAFGQSVDVNFATSVLPAKVGTNNVWFDGVKLSSADTRGLNGTISIESRGGKLANTHDGISFYYTRLSTAANFVLEADVNVEQFGPELEANPNGQEGFGLMVRDVIGAPRQEPLQEGYEEFPAASNMAVNLAQTKARKRDGELAIHTIYRDGVNVPWGNVDAIVPRSTYASVNITRTPKFKLKLARTDAGFIATCANIDGSGEVSQVIEGANANIVQRIDPRYMYVGFFAARNVRVSFSNARISLSKAHTVDAPKYVAPDAAPVFDIASPDVATTETYLLQVRASVNGKLSVKQDSKLVLNAAEVAASTLFALPLAITTTSKLTLDFVPTQGSDRSSISRELSVSRQQLANAMTLYAANDGKLGASGTQAAPLDVASAVMRLAPGGTLFLMDGAYADAPLMIPLAASGAEGKLKTLQPLNAGKVVLTKMLALDANYWHVKGMEVAGVATGNGIRVTGSYNVLEDMRVHGSTDTGLQITTPSGTTRSLWPAHNLVLNSESFNNVDAARKNADGFAAKVGVGEGNVFRGCISHNNADDGWDLFNKIEDGPNDVVTIENSISYENGITYSYTPPVRSIGNGFKLGGEGLPVAHIVRNNIAFNNNMDGFSDNFNPGALQVSGNVAFNNARFNYIFRPGPFAKAADQGRFNNNLSLRTMPGKYSDAVVGVVDASNFFYELKGDRSISTSGKTLSAADFVSISPPLQEHYLQRDADGKVLLGGFLQRK